MKNIIIIILMLFTINTNAQLIEIGDCTPKPDSIHLAIDGSTILHTDGETGAITSIPVCDIINICATTPFFNITGNVLEYTDHNGLVSNVTLPDWSIIPQLDGSYVQNTSGQVIGYNLQADTVYAASDSTAFEIELVNAQGVVVSSYTSWDTDTFADTLTALVADVDAFGQPYEIGDNLIFLPDGDVVCIPEKGGSVNIARTANTDGSATYDFVDANNNIIASWCSGMKNMVDHHGTVFTLNDCADAPVNKDLWISTGNEEHDPGLKLAITGADYSDLSLTSTNHHLKANIVSNTSTAAQDRSFNLASRNSSATQFFSGNIACDRCNTTGTRSLAMAGPDHDQASNYSLIGSGIDNDQLGNQNFTGSGLGGRIDGNQNGIGSGQNVTLFSNNSFVGSGNAIDVIARSSGARSTNIFVGTGNNIDISGVLSAASNATASTFLDENLSFFSSVTGLATNRNSQSEFSGGQLSFFDDNLQTTIAAFTSVTANNNSLFSMNSVNSGTYLNNMNSSVLALANSGQTIQNSNQYRLSFD